MKGKNIEIELTLMIEAAEEVDDDLTSRLVKIYDWIKQLKSGEIQSKPLLSSFLVQLIEDAQTYIDLLEGNTAWKELTTVEHYWYGTLFPRWFQQDDLKLRVWRQKLNKEYSLEDNETLKQIGQRIHEKQGSTWRSFIADFSMATDLIASSYYQQRALCVQLTTLHPYHQQNKYQQWLETLKYWQIPRGLFLSYDPSNTNQLNRLVNTILMNSDSCPDGEYKQFDA